VSLFSPRLRIIAIGLLIHLVLDGTDCFWTDWLILWFLHQITP